MRWALRYLSRGREGRRGKYDCHAKKILYHHKTERGYHRKEAFASGNRCPLIKGVQKGPSRLKGKAFIRRGVAS